MREQVSDGGARRPGGLIEVQQPSVRRGQHGPRGHELGDRRQREGVRGITASGAHAIEVEDGGGGMVGSPRIDRGEDIVEAVRHAGDASKT